MLLAIEAEDEMLPVREWAKADVDVAFEFGAGGAPDPPRPASEDIFPKTSW